MEFAIAIPSKGRPEVIKNYTLKFLNNLSNVFVFVEPQDYEDYLKSLPNTNIIVLGENNKGIAYARRSVQKFFFENKIRYVWQLDDNIDDFLIREGVTSGGYPKLVGVENAESILKDTLNIMKSEGYIQASISFKPSNWYEEGLLKINTRIWGVVLNDNTKMVENNILYDYNADTFEDYDITAQSLKKGFKNVCFYKYAFHKKMAHHKGGCQTYRNKEFSEKICANIVSKYGDAIKISFNEKHKIFEPQFNWKKLTESKG